MRRLYAGSPAQTEADFIASGLPKKVAAFMAANPPPPFELWACNVKTFDLFDAMSTQWRIGINGASGLDYAALAHTARLLGVKLTRARFAEIRAMETEALAVMREKKG